MLPNPPCYFPPRRGKYEVAPGFNRFGKDLGGGIADQQVFQFDRTFQRYREAKLAVRTKGQGFFTHELTDLVLAQVIDFITARLTAEHPTLFRFERDARLECAPTHDTIALRNNEKTLDALACQVQEDLAIVSTAPGRGHWLSALHVCMPSGWTPQEKIGKSFASVHQPVPGMTEMNRREEEFVNIMVQATQGVVRFAWSIAFDDRLDHHPLRPRAAFDPANPQAFLRVERQTIWGFPHVGAALFTIRTYLYDCADLRRDPATRDPLVAAVRSMSAESRAYKGMAAHGEEFIDWLSSG